jgi:8-oxo-dGTP diphosphatase
MSGDKRKEKAANTVVRHSDTGEFLVVQRSAHDSMPLSWEFPGGGVDEEDSSPEEAALRELEEETGLRAEMIEHGDSDTVELEEKFLEIHVFMVEVVKREVELSDEHRDFQWVSKTEVKKFESENIRKDLEAVR